MDFEKYGLTLAGPVRLRNVKVVSPLPPEELLLPPNLFAIELPVEENVDRTSTAAVHIWSPTSGCENLAAHFSTEDRLLLCKALKKGRGLLENMERKLVSGIDKEIYRLLGKAERSGREVHPASRTANGNSIGAENVLSDPRHPRVAESTLPEDIAKYKVWEATARLIACAEVSELGLLSFLVSVVEKRKSLLIGEIGQALRDMHKEVGWSILLKERFGGLKKFLRSASGVFIVGTEHPLNPKVRICEEAHTTLKNMAKLEEVRMFEQNT